jgi:restriction system protein
VLNDVFKLDGLSIRKAFTLNTEDGRVGEQIDGLIVLDGHPVLVEAKWHTDPLGVNDVSRHPVRVYGRPPGVHGLIVSASEFATPAIEDVRAL